MFEDYEPFEVALPDVVLRGRRTRDLSGPPLVLLHGHPETHLMWHRVADELATRFTVIAPDLRGYGASSRPTGGGDHAAYSKRAMAQDVLALTRHFGIARFGVVGHDRGGRVAARLAADHAETVTGAVLLDIVPTAAMYAAASRELAESYWHWFFLTQPPPMPERLIEADPRAYVLGVMGARYAGLTPFPEEVLDAYVAALSGPGAAYGICEDYRAAAGIDLVHDAQDEGAGWLVEPPLHVVWGRHSLVGRRFDPIVEWQKVGRLVSGGPVDCGHYLPEEAPSEVIAEVSWFCSQSN